MVVLNGRRERDRIFETLFGERGTQYGRRPRILRNFEIPGVLEGVFMNFRKARYLQ